MSRYIDAEELKRRYEHISLIEWNKRTTTSWADAFSEAADMIDDMPTADVAEVVRCKDCIFHEYEQPGMVYCPATVGGWVEDDWFCKGGIKRDEEE